MANIDPKDLVLTKKNEEKKYLGVVKGPKGDTGVGVLKTTMIIDPNTTPRSYKLKVDYTDGTSQVLSDKWYDGAKGESGINKVFGDEGRALKDISVQAPWYLTNLQEPTSDQMPVTLGYLNKNLWIEGEYKYMPIKTTTMPKGWVRMYPNDSAILINEPNTLDGFFIAENGTKGNETIYVKNHIIDHNNEVTTIAAELWQYDPKGTFAKAREEAIRKQKEQEAKEKTFIKDDLTFDNK